MNGKIGSGEASALPENAIMIAAPKIAMRLSLDACILNIDPPDRLRAHCGALLAASLQGGGFRTFASKLQNGFAAVTNVARVCRARKSAAGASFGVGVEKTLKRWIDPNRRSELR